MTDQKSETHNAYPEQLAATIGKIAEAQVTLWLSHKNFWQSTTAQMMGAKEAPLVEPAADDHRFKDDT